MAQNTELSEQILYGIDFKTRRIHFGVGLDQAPGDGETNTDFNNVSVEMAVRAIHKMVQDAPNKPIEIHMNSYGGSVYAGLYLHDVIMSSPCQFKFFGGGAIMSMATFIMVSCDERYLYPNARVMVHQISDEQVYSKLHEIKINVKESEVLEDVMNGIYEANTKMPKDFWADISREDAYLSAGEAVSLGMADKIVEFKKRGNLRKVRQHHLKKDVDLQGVVTDIYKRIGKRSIPQIQMNEIKKEAVDPSVVVDNSPLESKTPEQSPASSDQTIVKS